MAADISGSLKATGPAAPTLPRLHSKPLQSCLLAQRAFPALHKIVCKHLCSLSHLLSFFVNSRDFFNLHKKWPNMKLLCLIGGWGKNYAAKFHAMSLNAAHRQEKAVMQLESSEVRNPLTLRCRKGCGIGEHMFSVIGGNCRFKRDPPPSVYTFDFDLCLCQEYP